MLSFAKAGRFAHRQAFGFTQDLLGRRQGRPPLSACSTRRRHKMSVIYGADQPAQPGDAFTSARCRASQTTTKPLERKENGPVTDAHGWPSPGP